MPLSEALTPHLNLWLERDGQVVLSVCARAVVGGDRPDRLDQRGRRAHAGAIPAGLGPPRPNGGEVWASDWWTATRQEQAAAPT